MTTYTYHYEMLGAPAATVDGSGCVLHDIQAVSRPVGDTGAFTPIGGRHKQIVVPAAALNTVLAMTNNAAKVTAYKTLLAANLDTQTVPLTGWAQADLAAFMASNDAALLVAQGANTYLTVTLAQTYPIRFNM